MTTGGRWCAVALVAALIATGLAFAQQDAAEDPNAAWLTVDYRPLVDIRALTHSGEPLETILGRLQGRPLPPLGREPADRLDHTNIEPLLEGFAFLLSDTVDSLEPVSGPPMVEIGSLWNPGEPQPAWAELLRSRYFLVESDGQGRLRLFLPYAGGGNDSAAAGKAAFDNAWSVLRHVFAAERQRLKSGGTLPTLSTTTYAYFHEPSRGRFRLGSIPHQYDVTETDRRRRAPLDLEVFERFLRSGWQLEGARLARDGSLQLLGSETDRPQTLLGEPLSVTDFAVAARAVFHGGLAEPYMSLDRAQSPQSALVNYGGRLRDTRLGWVSLLCDIRFKTFSQGLGLYEDADLREAIREKVPEFRTHLEHLAADEAATDLSSQQTRLWFYPDKVDLTLSPQGDVLVMRDVRMSAASERVIEETQEARNDSAPWTLATVTAVDQHYDRLAELFPELHDLDRSVRLLALFSWLKQAEELGRTIPDVDALLAMELPAAPTPRFYPRLLAFNALPPAGAESAVEVFDRVQVAESMERLRPANGRLPAPMRLARAMASLNSTSMRHLEFIQEVEALELNTLSEAAIDLLAHRAERLAMHDTVLRTLSPEDRAPLMERQQGGETLRVFSVGIGGIDLGMGRVLRRARGVSSGLSWSAAAGNLSAGRRLAAAVPRRAAVAAGATAATAVSSAPAKPVPAAPMRAHGTKADTARVEHAPWSPEARLRALELGEDRRAVSIQRQEGARAWRYRLERGERGLVQPQGMSIPTPVTPFVDLEAARNLPAGLVVMTVLEPELGLYDPEQTVAVGLQARIDGEPLERFGPYPRQILKRAVVGPAATPGDERSLPGFDPLPDALGQVETLMLRLWPDQSRTPFDGGALPRSGEEDPTRLARGLREWWADGDDHPGVGLMTSPDRSLTRWRSAPLPTQKALLILPEGGFPAPFADLREKLAAAWPGPVQSEWDGKKAPELVVLISAEDPGKVGERMMTLAENDGLKGKLLAVWSLLQPLRGDLPIQAVGIGKLAAVGVAEGSVVEMRQAPQRLKELADALPARKGAQRIDRMPGPFVWYY